jgi:hypothetical protein
MAISLGCRESFDVLQQAFLAGDVALMECQLAVTGEPVAVIGAANRHGDGSTEFVPFAMMFGDNPYRIVNPPKPEGGFYSQQEIWEAD